MSNLDEILNGVSEANLNYLAVKANKAYIIRRATEEADEFIAHAKEELHGVIRNAYESGASISAISGALGTTARARIRDIINSEDS